MHPHTKVEHGGPVPTIVENSLLETRDGRFPVFPSVRPFTGRSLKEIISYAALNDELILIANLIEVL